MFPDWIMIRISLFSILFISITKCKVSTLVSVDISGTSPIASGKTAKIFCNYQPAMAPITAMQVEKYVDEGKETIVVYSYMKGGLSDLLGPIKHRARMQRTDGNFTLSINNVDTSDEGRYICIVYITYTDFKQTEPFELEVFIPLKLEAIHYSKERKTVIQCSGYVGKGTITMIHYQTRANNWKKFKSLKIERSNVNNMKITYVRKNIPVLKPRTLRVRCTAKNRLDKTIYRDEKDLFLGNPGKGKALIWIAASTSIVFLLLLCSSAFLVRRYRKSKSEEDEHNSKSVGYEKISRSEGDEHNSKPEEDEHKSKFIGDEHNSKSVGNEHKSKSIGDEHNSKSVGDEHNSKSVGYENIYRSVGDKNNSRSVGDEDMLWYSQATTEFE